MFNNNVGLYTRRKYNGYKIYSELFFEPQGDIGLPQFILINEKTNEIRYNNSKEWIEIMEKLRYSKKVKIDESADLIIFSNDLEYHHCNNEEKKDILYKISNV